MVDDDDRMVYGRDIANPDASVGLINYYATVILWLIGRRGLKCAVQAIWSERDYLLG